MKRFKTMLSLHWKAVRWPMVPFVLLCFGLPMLVLRIIQPHPGIQQEFSIYMLQAERGWVSFFPYLAFITGGLLGLTAWQWDHQARHVYGLSLPITRSRYATLKFGAGLALLAIPVVALLIGTLIGVGLTRLPEGLHAYPFSFAARFALGAMLAYALIFALASGTIRTTAMIVGCFIVIFVFGTLLVDYVSQATRPNDPMTTPMQLLMTVVTIWPGPFAVFGASWAIIDV
jgi:hypothetical protein